MYNPVKGEFDHIPKTYGRSLKPSELPEGMAKFFPENSIRNDPELLKAVVDGIAEQVREIKRIVEGIEMRMVGASLLIVWEGDEAALRACLVEDEGESKKAEAASGEGDDGAGSDESDEDDDDGPLAFAVKLIDFAHTRLAPGRGADAGVLLGLENTLKLLEGRGAQLSAAAKTH